MDHIFMYITNFPFLNKVCEKREIFFLSHCVLPSLIIPANLWVHDYPVMRNLFKNVTPNNSSCQVLALVQRIMLKRL